MYILHFIYSSVNEHFQFWAVVGNVANEYSCAIASKFFWIYRVK